MPAARFTRPLPRLTIVPAGAIICIVALTVIVAVFFNVRSSRRNRASKASTSARK